MGVLFDYNVVLFGMLFSRYHIKKGFAAHPSVFGLYTILLWIVDQI